ncbi:MAG: hypothetical protein A2481_00350 [Candidatus Yonathbacteria bacterium RIFOXYC2_FULL_47_9]|nr:MAG: hypothetical protein A2481_00350 [Candidatus Yonathbacteria bacterium RIFOXYC2_FULL_47_9]HAT68510.1 hypothetical protein [Candidatus Yonathbacteria bacterium]
MFEWLKGVRSQDLKVEKDPWADCSGSFYVASFRKKLDSIAKLLVHHGYFSVSTRFNLKTQCVELYDKNGVIVQVEVHGEYGAPCGAIVTCDRPVKSQLLFSRFLSGLKVKFKILHQGNSEEGGLA